MFMGNSCAHLFPPPFTELMQSSSSGDTPTNEWVLMGVVSSQGLGTPERFKKLREMRQKKTEHGETIVTSSHHKHWFSKLNSPTYNSYLEERF